MPLELSEKIPCIDSAPVAFRAGKKVPGVLRNDHRESFIKPGRDCTHHEFHKAKPFMQFDVRKFMRDDDGIDASGARRNPTLA